MKFDMKPINEYCKQILFINEYLSTKILKKKIESIEADWETEPIRTFAKSFIDIIMKGRTISYKDFEKVDKDVYKRDDMYCTCNVPQDGELALEFYKHASGGRNASTHGSEGTGYVSREIMTENENAFIKINLDPDEDHYDGLYHNPVGDIISIDMSKNIMDILFE